MPLSFQQTPVVYSSTTEPSTPYVPVDEFMRAGRRMMGQSAATVNAYCEWLQENSANFELRYDATSDSYLVKSNITEIHDYGKATEEPVGKIKPRKGGIKRRTAL